MKKRTLICLLTLLSFALFASDTRKYNIVRAALAPKVDGRQDDECWKQAAVATDFITNSPQFGFPGSLKTEVKMAYDNSAIYIIAVMHDSLPGKMLSPLTERD